MRGAAAARRGARGCRHRPTGVVDHEHDGPRCATSRAARAAPRRLGREGPPASGERDRVRADPRSTGARFGRDRRGEHGTARSREHRDQLGIRAGTTRDRRLGPRDQVAGEPVDDAVERVVRHPLALVTAAAQHEQPAGARADGRTKCIDERRLADAGLALDDDTRRAAASTAASASSSAASSASRPTNGGSVVAARRGRRAVSRAEQLEDLASLGTLARIACSRCMHSARDRRARRRRTRSATAPRACCLSPRVASASRRERQPPGQRLEQQTPTAYQSAAGPTASPRACSGAM